LFQSTELINYIESAGKQKIIRIVRERQLDGIWKTKTKEYLTIELLKRGKYADFSIDFINFGAKLNPIGINFWKDHFESKFEHADDKAKENLRKRLIVIQPEYIAFRIEMRLCEWWFSKVGEMFLQKRYLHNLYK